MSPSRCCRELALAGALVCTSSVLAQSTTLFSSPARYRTQQNPTGVVLADFNGDGFADIAATNKDSDSVSVFFNNGTGGFLTGPTLATGAAPRIPAAADLDHDGDIDLVVPNWEIGADSISVLLNQGTGQFASQVVIPAHGQQPRTVVIGDLDKDGNQDLVTSNQGSDDATIFMGDGTGGFSFGLNLITGRQPGSVSIGDLNADDNPDLVFTNRGEHFISVFLNRGNEPWGPAQRFDVLSSPKHQVIADLNGDFTNDIAVVNGPSNTISILFNDGNGNFGGHTIYQTATAPHAIVAADFDKDCDNDLAVVCATDSFLQFFINNVSAGTFLFPINFRTGNDPLYLDAVDLNNDTELDIVTANQAPDTVSVHMNEPGRTTPIDSILVSFKDSLTIPGPGVVNNEDVLLYDVANNEWTTLFDGSDVGLGGVVLDAMAVLPDGRFVLSFDRPTEIPNLLNGPDGGLVDDSDLVLFNPINVGYNTQGFFEFYFDGSDIGLDTEGEDIDAVSYTPDGRLVLSTNTSFVVPGPEGAELEGSGQDLILFVQNTFGAETSGYFVSYLVGRNVGMETADENIDALSLSPEAAVIISTRGPFYINGIAGDDEDILRLPPTGACSVSAGPLFLIDLSARGIPEEQDVGSVELPGPYSISHIDPRADWNGDDSVDSQDFFDFLENYFDADADFNLSGSTDSQDYFDFLEVFLNV